MTDKTPFKSSIVTGPVMGTINVPGDKSLSHRSLIFAALAEGTTQIEGLLESDDVLNTAAALRTMGADIQRIENTQNENKITWIVKGCGKAGLAEPSDVLDMGNSGTAARLLTGVLAGQNFRSFISGDHSLNQRPMRRVIKPLSEMGVSFMARQDQFLPMMVEGQPKLKAINYTSPVASAQVKAAILLAGLNADGETSVIEPHLSRDHTERMGAAFGWEITTENLADGAVRVSTKGGQNLKSPQDILVIPSDPSSAAFVMAAAVLVKDSDITICNVNVNPTRIGFITCLIDMGAKIEFLNERTQGGEPVADIRTQYSPNIKGITVPEQRVPSMIDEFPIFSVVASCAVGETVMTGLSELRVKESDRLSAMAQGLASCGVALQETEDGMIVTGQGHPPAGLDTDKHGPIPTYFDHRIAMSFLILGAVTEKAIIVDDINAIATSFPSFINLMKGLGLDLSTIAS